jgi:hypothetical protein
MYVCTKIYTYISIYQYLKTYFYTVEDGNPVADQSQRGG